MRPEEEVINCLESFERRCRIEQNPETKKLWTVLKRYTEFILGRRGNMHYNEYSIESDLDIDPLPRRDPTLYQPKPKDGVDIQGGKGMGEL